MNHTQTPEPHEPYTIHSNSNFHGARPVHLTITITVWIRTSDATRGARPPTLTTALACESPVPQSLKKYKFVKCGAEWTAAEGEVVVGHRADKPPADQPPLRTIQKLTFLFSVQIRQPTLETTSRQIAPLRNGHPSECYLNQAVFHES